MQYRHRLGSIQLRPDAWQTCKLVYIDGAIVDYLCCGALFIVELLFLATSAGTVPADQHMIYAQKMNALMLFCHCLVICQMLGV